MAAPGADKPRRCPQQHAGPSPIIAADASISSATPGPLLPASPTPIVSRMKMRAARTAAAGRSWKRVRLTCSAKRRMASRIGRFLLTVLDETPFHPNLDAHPLA